MRHALIDIDRTVKHKPGTDAYNCVVCGATPFEQPVYRQKVTRQWFCGAHSVFDIDQPTAMFMFEGPLYLPRTKLTFDGPQEPQQTIPLSIDGVECPASMCPLIAKDGSPNAGVYAGKCPEHDDLDHGGCPWWKIGCSTGLQRELVLEELETATLRIKRDYDCPKASVCSWQRIAEKAGHDLCPPRTALFLGLDPRVVNWA